MIDIGGFAIEADKYGLTLHRKRNRTNRKTGALTPYLELVGHYATFGQVANRVAHMATAEAINLGADLDTIRQMLDATALRIEDALNNHTNQGESHAAIED